MSCGAVHALVHRPLRVGQDDDRATSSRPSWSGAACVVENLDGDVVRTHLSKGLGFSKEDRDTNIERIGWVASRLTRHGAAVIVVRDLAVRGDAAQGARARRGVRARSSRSTSRRSVEECARRDVKGLYAKARAGEITEFTGVSDPYEEPASAGAAPRHDAARARGVARSSSSRSSRSSAAWECRRDRPRQAHASAAARGRGDRRHARGRRRGREPGDAVLDRQGQLGHAAPRAQGVPSRAAAVPVPARRHDVEVPGHVPLPRAHGRPSTTSTCSCT